MNEAGGGEAWCETSCVLRDFDEGGSGLRRIDGETYEVARVDTTERGEDSPEDEAPESSESREVDAISERSGGTAQRLRLARVWDCLLAPETTDSNKRERRAIFFFDW